MILRIVLAVVIMSSILAQAQDVDKNSLRAGDRVIFTEKAPLSPPIKDLVNLVKQDSLNSTLQYLDKKGIRYSIAALDVIRGWISGQLTQYGYVVTVQDVTSCGKNIIVEKKGTKYPEKYIFIGAHYDSISGGAGINDNGTGTIILLEIARVLQKADSEYSIIMVWFVGEERGMVGSNAYVGTLTIESKNVLVMFNMDEVGGVPNQSNAPAGMTTVTCERDMGNAVSTNDAASTRYTDTLAMVTNTYTKLKTTIDRAYGSDYLSFEKKGYVITGYYEMVSGGNPYYHTANDILKNTNVPYIFEVAKGAVAFTASIAHSQIGTSIGSLSGIVDKNTPLACRVHTDPGSGRLNISWRLEKAGLVQFDLFDMAGKKIASINAGMLPKGNHTIDFGDKFPGSGMAVVRPIVDRQPLASQRIFFTKGY